MNLKATRSDILGKERNKKNKKNQKKENELFIEKVLYDFVKASGEAIIQKALDDLMRDFEKGF